MDKIVIMCVTLYLSAVRFFMLAMQPYASGKIWVQEHHPRSRYFFCDAHHVRRSFALTTCGYSVFECAGDSEVRLQLQFAFENMQRRKSKQAHEINTDTIPSKSKTYEKKILHHFGEADRLFIV